MAKRRAAIKLTKFDPVEYLKTEEDMALYLDACLKEAATIRPSSLRPSATSLAPVASASWPKRPG